VAALHVNVIRPTVGVCWFVAFAAHALHRWPQNRERLRPGDAVAHSGTPAQRFRHRRRAHARDLTITRGDQGQRRHPA
jgi:alkylated DNA repair dioxygenase AlkB